MSSQRSKLVFMFDISCPYAYIASTQVEALAQRCCAQLEWRPVLLGALIKANQTQPPSASALANPNPNVKYSASATMPAAKQALLAGDLMLQAARFNCPVRFHPRHPVRSLLCMRLLAASPQQARAQLARALYRAYWVRHEDIDDGQIVAKCARECGIDVALLDDPAGKAALQQYTDDALRRGVFGVPTFLVGDAETMYYGGDRMHFVEKALGNPQASLLRLCPVALLSAPRISVKFYFDFASPWAFLGSTQLHKLAEVADVRMAPILLGALFRDIGTPVVPMQAISEAKRQYGAQDLNDWAQWWGEKLVWPDAFPLRTTVDCIFCAAWQKNLDIGKEPVLRQVLSDAGFPVDSLIEKANSDSAKVQLRRNTQEAMEAGVIGVPTYVVEAPAGTNAYTLWGQDRAHLVMDIACGWRPNCNLKQSTSNASRL